MAITDITSAVCKYLIQTYEHGCSNDFVYLAPLARAWLDLTAQVAAQKAEIERLRSIQIQPRPLATVEDRTPIRIVEAQFDD